ncbi:DEAD/DEAH box helicase [Prauserella cavernicola]|uniref:AAA family ATPase n=1 Tax=Prauserella cavernicola TaxID=2800127 RepID=A0A934V4K1_9PSEU|nr:AAA domain-containing protein [Prauserella cavernicola]MBK1785502.1 AAA family ATPase [Prauserella cavernicola]
MSRTVKLAKPVVLVPSQSFDSKLHRQARDNPGLPAGVAQIAQHLAERDGVPATVEEMSGSRSLKLYTYGYVVGMFPTRDADAYTLAWITPLRLRDHQDLARGHLLIRATWRTVTELRHVPQGSSAQWPQLTGEWAKLQRTTGDQRGVPDLDPAHERFLDTLDRLIDTTRTFNARKADDLSRFPYSGVETAGERRYSSASSYVFRMVGDRRPERGRFVQLQGEPEQRGEVTRVEGDRVTVRFDQPVDWRRLARQGDLEETPNEVVYAKQHEAVRALRTRQAENRTVLPALVDHRVAPIQQVREIPSEELDSDQLSAFRASLGVQDMLVVLGPPGTGKTRTISQVARACALSRERGRVLVTSYTNRAVDNVLAKLPKDVVVVRVGNEGKIGSDALPFLLERWAEDLRSEVLSTSEASLRGYRGLPTAVQWRAELGKQIGLLHVEVDAEAAALRQLHAARRAGGGPAQQRVEALEAELAEHGSRARQLNERLQRLLQQAARADARRAWPLVRAWSERRARARHARIEAVRSELASCGEHARHAQAQLSGALVALDVATRDLPQIRQITGQLHAIEGRRDARRRDALAALEAVRAIVRPVDEVPAVPDSDAPSTLAALTDLHARLGPRLDLLARRSTLLGEWHADASKSADQLYPELIRYADVVGATTTGAATRSEIAETEFDLAIVDEAGQIGTADLLVPVVRAKRAVLVGDHRQLPPFVDRDVVNWSNDLDDPELRALVRKSGLEILVGHLPATHIVSLTQQRRMPRVIADFISEAFYDGNLTTHVERAHADPLFTQPLAFVDTSRLPDRAERPAGGGNGSWVNHAEARLLAALASFYHARREEWALIVPYKAQLNLVRRMLGEDIPDLRTVDNNVGTVDAFQGGERDIILYGFTRSNAAGNVGFLQDLRRANVALTRAKRQLVLVGDIVTLLNARDEGFQQFACALRDHVRAHGDVRHHHDLMTMLAEKT